MNQKESEKEDHPFFKVQYFIFKIFVYIKLYKLFNNYQFQTKLTLF